jgi:hypothetical protein
MDAQHSKFTAGYFRIFNVPGRSGVLIHQGNYCGDINKGYKSHVEGCILVGTGTGDLDGQQAVLDSRGAMDKLRKYIGGSNFELVIIDGFPG